MKHLMRFIAFLIFLIFVHSGCSAYSSGMSGIVVDSQTGKPIDGAVVLVEWTITKGIGLTSTESYKVVETLTNKEGKFNVLGITNPRVNPPDVTVYKKGYVCWSSRIIFPDYRNRTDFEWRDGFVFRLNRFKPEYSYIEHTSFISSAAKSAMGKKDLIKDAYRWEELEASKERDGKRK